MNGSYFCDHVRQRNWGFIPKNASTNLRSSIGETTFDSKDMLNPDYKTVTILRCWQDRIVSALYSVLRDGRTFAERVDARILHPPISELNSHVRPQSSFVAGLKLDHVLRVETLRRDWNKLRRIIPGLAPLSPRIPNKHRPIRWQDEPYDWSLIAHLYAEDEKLCAAYPIS